MPSNKTSPVFLYVYVLESIKDGDRYAGYTQDLRRRFEEHQKGKGLSTIFRRPFELIYYEACRDKEDAKQRERYLKTTAGRRFMAKRFRRFNLHRAWHLK